MVADTEPEIIAAEADARAQEARAEATTANDTDS
jgi:hypothetical protein